MSQRHAAATKSCVVHTWGTCLCERNVTLSLPHVSKLHVVATCHLHVKTYDLVAARSLIVPLFNDVYKWILGGPCDGLVFCYNKSTTSRSNKDSSSWSTQGKTHEGERRQQTITSNNDSWKWQTLIKPWRKGEHSLNYEHCFPQGTILFDRFLLVQWSDKLHPSLYGNERHCLWITLLPCSSGTKPQPPGTKIQTK